MDRGVLGQNNKTNYELLLELNSVVELTFNQAIYLAFNTAMVDKLINCLRQGEVETIKETLIDIENLKR